MHSRHPLKPLVEFLNRRVQSMIKVFVVFKPHPCKLMPFGFVYLAQECAVLSQFEETIASVIVFVKHKVSFSQKTVYLRSVF